MSNVLDFRQYAGRSKPHYSTLLDTSIPIADQVLELIKHGCLFPNHDVASCIVANYLILPSALLEVCPILFLCGKQGSGKSQVGILASKLHNSTIFSSASTFAAIRNALTLNRMKRHTLPKKSEDEMPDSIEIEKNIFLIWDDIDPQLLATEKQLYRILKNGYNRSTSQIQISAEKIGSNLSFNCFSPKLLSSVSNLCLDSRFRELNRRCLLIETKPLEELNQSARELNPDHTDYVPEQLIDFTQYDWDGFHAEFIQFWNDVEKLERYGRALIDVDKALKDAKIKWTANQIAISRETIAVGVIADLYLSLNDAIDIWSDFWQSTSDAPYKAHSILISELGKALDVECKSIDSFNSKYRANLIYSVKSSHLQSLINSLVSLGSLPSNPSALEVKQAMLTLGWYPNHYDWLRKS